MEKIEIGKLVLDFDLYPRVDVDSQHVGYLRQADDADAELPPIIADAKSKRVIDGFHRVKMYRGKYDESYKVNVILKKYESEGQMLLDSIRYNAGHGRILTRYDRTHCILMAEKLQIHEDELACALNMTIEKVGQLKVERIGKLQVGESISSVPLKRTIRHMAGRKLNKRQQEVNEQLSGMNQVFYVNQVIMLLESKLLNKEDDLLLSRLKRLWSLLSKMKELRRIAEAS